MKKQTILFLASGLLALASCGNNNAPQENAQAKIDSMQKAMDMQKREQAMKDSMATVMAVEKAKADSLAGVMAKEKEQASTKGTHSGTHKGKSAAKETTPPPPPTSQSKWNSNQQQNPDPNKKDEPTSKSKWGK